MLHYTKEIAKITMVIILGILLTIAMIFIKYKIGYEVNIGEEKIGYINNIEQFNSKIEKEIINREEEYIGAVSLTEEPTYKLKLLARTNSTEEEILQKIKSNYTITMYKYYEVSLNNETKSYVNSLQEAEKIVNGIKEEFIGSDIELNLLINEHYTEDIEEISKNNLEDATNIVEVAAQELKEESQYIAKINDVKISVLPVSGKITSRYGESSRRRVSTHTGLDIATNQGVDIKAVADGKVTFASYKGSYGNLVKIEHTGGIETWYGHCSKIYVKVGDEVKAGDVISAVGSTGNSTGPHLHFEIRINGETVNPQKYIY